MSGLLFVGVALLLGITMRLPPENNLLMDDHLIYAFVLIGLAAVGAGKTLGLGEWWARTGVVQRYPWLG